METIFPGGRNLATWTHPIGVICKGKGNGNFEAIPLNKTGSICNGDVRDITVVQTSKGAVLVCSRNNAPVVVSKINQ